MATLVLVVNARPQDYDDDYDQPTAKLAGRKQPQQVSQQRNLKNDDRETSTWIPIIHYDKQQRTDGSYQTQ